MDSLTTSPPVITVPMSLEFFFKTNSLATTQYLFGIAPTNAFYAYINSAGQINFAGPTAGCGSATNITSAVITAGTQYHLAYVINASGIGTLYLNGTPLPPVVTSLTPCASSAFAIGSAAGGGLYFNGTIDEFRISNVDRSINGGTSYPVPSTPYFQDGNTTLLIHMNSLNTVDYSSSGTGMNSSLVTLVTSFLP